MTPSVRLSRKSALALLAYTSENLVSSATTRAHEELRRALEPKSKTSAKRKTEKRNRSKRKETKSVRAEVMARADGRCECGCCAPSTPVSPFELDHFWGKGKAPQTVENCWLLRRDHHLEKTDGEPSSTVWLERFYNHCKQYGYAAEASKARAKLEARELMQASASVGCP